MDDSTFLIIGANGQLGTALKNKYTKAKTVDQAELDITDIDKVRGFDWNSISTILNAAAYTNVDGAETAEGRVAAWKVNATGVANLSKVAIENGLTLVHISTDYVFDGTKEVYTENESFSPLSVYGASKAGGDVAVMMVPKHYLLRTSWVIGEGKNFIRTMLELGRQGVSPAVVADQKGRPTFTAQLVDGIDHLLRNKCPFGTYNISNDGKVVSWADLARVAFSDAGLNITVTDTDTEKYFQDKPEAAKRPLNSSFDLSKIKATGLQLRDWQDDLKDYVNKEMEKQ